MAAIITKQSANTRHTWKILHCANSPDLCYNKLGIQAAQATLTHFLTIQPWPLTFRTQSHNVMVTMCAKYGNRCFNTFLTCSTVGEFKLLAVNTADHLADCCVTGSLGQTLTGWKGHSRNKLPQWTPVVKCEIFFFCWALTKGWGGRPLRSIPSLWLLIMPNLVALGQRMWSLTTHC